MIMQQVVLELPENVEVPDDLEGGELLDMLSLMRKLWGRRKPENQEEARELGRKWVKVSQGIHRTDEKLKDAFASLDRTQNLLLDVASENEKAIKLCKEAVELHPWLLGVQIGEEEMIERKALKWKSMDHVERRMCEVARVSRSLGDDRTTAKVKEIFDGIIAPSVIQKDFNTSKVEDWIRDNEMILSWWTTKRGEWEEGQEIYWDLRDFY